MQSMPDISALLKIAQSPAGQKLLTMLQSDPSADLNNLAAAAASGDLEEARNKLRGLLASREARDLLQQLEDQL